VQIGTVTLTGLSLDLLKTADGADNWTLETAEETAPEAADGGAASPIGLSVEGVVLRDGVVRYRDLGAGLDYTVSDVAFESGLAMSGDRLTISRPTLSLAATGSDLPGEVTADVDVQTVVADLAAGSATIDRLTLELLAAGARLRVSGGGSAGSDAVDLQGDFALAETTLTDLLARMDPDAFRPANPDALQRVSAQGRWSLGTASVNVTGLIVQIDDSRLTGTAAIDDFDTLASRFDLSVDAFDLDDYLPAETETAAPATDAEPAEPTRIPLEALADMPLEGRLRIDALTASGVTLEAMDLSLNAGDGNVSTSLSARGLGGSMTLEGAGRVAGDTPALTGTLTVRDLSPRALLAALEAPAETANPDVLQRFAGRAAWRLTPKSASLTDMRWQLDDTTLTGTAGIDDLDRLAASFDVNIDRLDLDAYLPPEAEAEEADAEDAELIPVDAIRDLALDGRLRAGQLAVSGLTLRNVDARVSARDGVLRLAPLTAALYGGEYRGTITVDATGATPALTLDQSLSAVQIGEVLDSFFATDLVSGALSLKLAGTGTGNTMTDLIRGLAADVSVDLSDGVYRGTNLTWQLERARALLRNQAAPPPPETETTPIRSLAATGRMVDGVLQTSDLSARTDALQLLGSGGINLLELALDYDLSARVIEGTAAAERLGDLAGLNIPLSLSGPLAGPKVGVDLKGLLTNTLRDTVRSRARDALLDRLGGTETDEAGAESTGTGASAADDGQAAGAAPEPEPEPESEPPSPKDLLKRGLRDLLRPKPDPAPSSDEGGDG
jgi:AsmA protein